MITLFDTETNQPVGQITEEQLRFLMNQLEEESTMDRDYYIDLDTLDILEEAGADLTGFQFVAPLLLG
jgi:processive 1,2-diacylglycerol beta-glucosyltransferase